MTATETHTHALANEAKAVALSALAKANEALDRCDRAEASVAGLAHVVNRCTNEVLELRRASTEHHAETLAAIDGAKLADRQHAGQLRNLETRLTALDLAKLAVAGGGGSALVAVILGIAALLLGRPLPPQAPPYAAPAPYAVPAPTPPSPSPTHGP